MLTSTTAIVLSIAKHNDKSSILRAYTRAGGRTNYIMYGHRFRPSPLSLVEITYDLQPTRDLQTVKTISLLPIAAADHSEVASDTMSRRCVSLFMAELLQSIFLHPMEDEQMYDFLEDTARDVACCPDPENAHLRFLVLLSQHLGFGIPSLPGVVEQTASMNSEADAYSFLWSNDPNNGISRLHRQTLLRALVSYLVAHIEGLPVPRSLDILTEVFD